jgi:hypothetical protein
MSFSMNNSGSVCSFALAALGLYLGLVLTGTSSTIAQSPMSDRSESKSKAQRRGNDQARSGDKAIEQFAATLEDLYRVAYEIASADPAKTEKGRFSLNYFVSVKPNGASRFTSVPASGDDASGWSGRYREPFQRLYDAFLPRTDEWNDDLFVQFDLGPEDVTLKASLVVDPTSNDTLLAELQQASIKQRVTASDQVRSQIYGAAQVSVQKNKIVVVANLPRAGLESLLTKNDK